MVQNLYAKAKGGAKREELNSKVRRFHIFEGQTASVTCLREENEAIRDELEEWKQNYKDLKSESKQLFEEMYAAIQEKEQSVRFKLLYIYINLFFQTRLLRYSVCACVTLHYVMTYSGIGSIFNQVSQSPRALTR